MKAAAALSKRILSNTRRIGHPNLGYNSNPGQLCSALRKPWPPSSLIPDIRKSYFTMSSSAAEQQPQEAAATVTPKAEETPAAAPAEPALPPLSPAEFRVYNQMAEKMDYFVSRKRKPAQILSVTFAWSFVVPRHR